MMEPWDWKPKQHHKDPVANAILNVAESIARFADAAEGLTYALGGGDNGPPTVGESLRALANAAHDAVVNLAANLETKMGRHN